MIGEVFISPNLSVSVQTAFILFGIFIATVTGIIAYFVHKHIVSNIMYQHRIDAINEFHKGRKSGQEEAYAFMKKTDHAC